MSKNEIVSAEQFNQMTNVSHKGMLAAICILFALVSSAYLILFTGVFEEKFSKNVFCNGVMENEIIDVDLSTRHTLGLDSKTGNYMQYITVFTENEYNKNAPVVGAVVELKDDCEGTVVSATKYDAYDDLLKSLETREEDLIMMGIFPDDGAYYVLNILSDNTSCVQKGDFVMANIVFGRLELKKLLFGNIGDK